MSQPAVLLINPNFMKPPIAPVGLDYVADALTRRGYAPVLCDLTFSEDWTTTLDDALAATGPMAVGITVRNIDDAYFASQDFLLEKTAEVVQRVQETTNAPVVLGGVGFSAAPRAALAYLGAHYGIAGEGEDAFPALLDCIVAGRDPRGVPGVLHRTHDGVISVTPPAHADLAVRATPSRSFVDNPRYFAEGGQGGIETKRGCNGWCVYCVDPVAKGRRLRLRPPVSVAEEFAALLDQGVDTIHLCDSEFNLPPGHARAVCDALLRQGLAKGDSSEATGSIRWYTYACPRPFDADLAGAIRRAGCVGVNFGVDHTDEGMLQRLGRKYGPEDIRRAVTACREAGIVVMCDMLLGSPGETRESIHRAIDFMRQMKPDRVGLSCGVRVYPHTPLATFVREQGPLCDNPNLHGTRQDNDDLLRPIFYVDAGIGEDIHGLVWSLVKDDNRFFAADPEQADRNYNYNDNSVLAEAIRAGERGAYWDILRRIAEA